MLGIATYAKPEVLRGKGVQSPQTAAQDTGAGAAGHLLTHHVQDTTARKLQVLSAHVYMWGERVLDFCSVWTFAKYHKEAFYRNVWRHINV